MKYADACRNGHVAEMKLRAVWAIFARRTWIFWRRGRYFVDPRSGVLGVRQAGGPAPSPGAPCFAGMQHGVGRRRLSRFPSGLHREKNQPATHKGRAVFTVGKAATRARAEATSYRSATPPAASLGSPGVHRLLPAAQHPGREPPHQPLIQAVQQSESRVSRR